MQSSYCVSFMFSPPCVGKYCGKAKELAACIWEKRRNKSIIELQKNC